MTETHPDSASTNLLVELTADIVAAYVGNHVVPVAESGGAKVGHGSGGIMLLRAE